ncbi:copper-binding protein [Herminiimonas fonticola]|uniref:Cu/Ag efflux protein CusF n=1 Tax=Herminiimonas fonticola TaxID=303380 RepID=A0A4R6G146_9BURK|nr:copper-binding protein [Herminiimonas fonticola]RBA23643.1 hypothetical protein Hfont_2454 [Herminiimonas fonticola]TDN88049.1 Cu/Ag efflux protein CusF [Herminiimonas fonticola]
MKFLTKTILSILLAASATSLSYAADGSAESATTVTDTSKPHTPMSEGEVRKINKETGRVTIKHGPLANLDMPGMTMLFRLQDPAMIDQIKEGDRIRFVANKVDGAFVVQVLEVVK